MHTRALCACVLGNRSHQKRKLWGRPPKRSVLLASVQSIRPSKEQQRRTDTSRRETETHRRCTSTQECALQTPCPNTRSRAPSGPESAARACGGARKENPRGDPGGPLFSFLQRRLKLTLARREDECECRGRHFGCCGREHVLEALVVASVLAFLSEGGGAD